MKTIAFAVIGTLLSVGAAYAGDASNDGAKFGGAKLDMGLYTNSDAAAMKTNVYWYSRYGKRCYHGPVYIRACH